MYEEDDDEVVQEFDVFLSKCDSTNLMLVQYPQRSKGNPYIRTKGCLEKARFAVEDTEPEMLEFKVRSSSNFLQLNSAAIPHRTNYAVGTFHDGALFLQPLTSIHQMRPEFLFLDKEDEVQGLAEGFTSAERGNWINLDVRRFFDADHRRRKRMEICNREDNTQLNMVMSKPKFINLAFPSDKQLKGTHCMEGDITDGFTRQEISSIEEISLRLLALMKNVILMNYSDILKMIRIQKMQDHQQLLAALGKYCWLIKNCFVLRSQHCTGYSIRELKREDDYHIEPDTILQIKSRVLIRDYLLTLFAKHSYINRRKHFIHNTTFCPPPKMIQDLLESLGTKVRYRPEDYGEDGSENKYRPDFVWVLKVESCGVFESKHVQKHKAYSKAFEAFALETDLALIRTGGLKKETLTIEEMRRFFSKTFVEEKLILRPRLEAIMSEACKTSRYTKDLSYDNVQNFITRFCREMRVPGLGTQLLFRKTLNNPDADEFRNLMIKFFQDPSVHRYENIVKRKTIIAYCMKHNVTQPSDVNFRTVMSEFCRQSAKGSGWMLRFAVGGLK